MELKTYVCPNCGANATNAQNCEYCGSLLVRFVDKGVSLSQPLDEIYDKTKYIPGVHNAIVSHWKRREQMLDDYIISTVIYPSKYEDSAIQILSNDTDIMCMDFILENPEQIAKVKAFPDFFLLDVRNDDNEAFIASIEFGNDIEYATKFISTFLREVFDQPIDKAVDWEDASMRRSDDSSRSNSDSESGISGNSGCMGIIIALIVSITTLCSVFF